MSFSVSVSNENASKGTNWEAARRFSKNIFNPPSNLIKLALPVVLSLGAVYWAAQYSSEEVSFHQDVNQTADASVVDLGSSTAIGLLQDVALFAAGGIQAGFMMLGALGVGAHLNRTEQRDFKSFSSLEGIAEDDFENALEILQREDGDEKTVQDVLENSDLEKLLSKVVREGDIEIAKRIAQYLPPEKVPGNWFFQRDWQECFANPPAIDWSRFSFNATAVGQFNCRTLLLTEAGEVYSFPGVNARAIAEQLAAGQNMDSFTIYFNKGHASVAIGDEHVGFYPISADDSGPKHLLRFEASFYGSLHGMFKTIEFIDGRLPDGVLFGKNPVLRSSLMGSAFLGDTACQIIDDSKERKISEDKNGLRLKLFLPKEKVEAAYQYMRESRDLCGAGRETYELWNRNCIDFAQRVLEATGIRADFRDAFYTTDYLRRMGTAMLYTMLRSNSPLTDSANSLESMSFPEMIDRIPRSYLLGLAVILIAFRRYRYVQKRLGNVPRDCRDILVSIQSLMSRSLFKNGKNF